MPEIYENLIGGGSQDVYRRLIGGDAAVSFYLAISDLNPIDSVDVTTLGVTGNGVTDDTAAIQAACNSGKVLYFPKTVNFYKTTGFINLTASIWSNGAEIRIAQDGTNNTSVFKISNNTIPIVIYGFILNGLYAGGIVSEFSSGVQMIKATNVTIAFNTIKNMYGDNVSIYQASNASPPWTVSQGKCKNITVRDNTLSNPRRCNIAITGADGVSIINNKCTKSVNYVSAIDMEPDLDGFSFLTNIYIADNSFDNSPTGYIIQAIANNGAAHTNLVMKRNIGIGDKFFLVNANALLTEAYISDNIFTSLAPADGGTPMFDLNTVLRTWLIRNIDRSLLQPFRSSLVQTNCTLFLKENVFLH